VQYPRPLKQFACMKEAKLAPFLFADSSVILLIWKWLGMICNSKDGLRTLAHPTALSMFKIFPYEI